MERYVGSTVPEPLAFRIVGGGSPARSTAALLLGVALRFVRGCASARCRASRAVLTPKGHVYWGFRRALVSQPRTPVLSVLPMSDGNFERFNSEVSEVPGSQAVGVQPGALSCITAAGAGAPPTLETATEGTISSTTSSAAGANAVHDPSSNSVLSSSC